MKYIKIFCWFMVFVLIDIYFNLNFTMVIGPAGRAGRITPAYSVASLVFIIFWSGLAIFSGYRKNKEILLAAMIHSLLPVLGLFLACLPVVGILLSILLTLCYSVPIQGIGVEDMFLMFSIQPIIFLIGYRMGKYLQDKRSEQITNKL